MGELSNTFKFALSKTRNIKRINDTSGSAVVTSFIFSCVVCNIKDAIKDGNLLEVEIKDGNGNLGWLYDELRRYLVLVDDNDNPEIMFLLRDLKSVVEARLKSKKFSDKPKRDHLVRNSNAVYGYISISDLNQLEP